MAKAEHLEKLRLGRDPWNKWRKTQAHPRGYIAADLTDVDLTDINLVEFNLDRTSFARSRLHHAWLTYIIAAGVDFNDADLSDSFFDNTRLVNSTLEGTLLTRVGLGRSRFEGCSFRGAKLHKADLTMSLFERCEFEEADLADAVLHTTVFANCHLAGSRNLETIRHNGSSSIGVDTLVRSPGLPESFLRGCGLPDDVITYATALAANPIEYYSCFISYASADEVFARRLHADLQTRNIRTWFAAEHIKIGERFRDRIDESILIYDKLVLILSQAAINSAWVRREVEAAIDREDREGRNLLFPIRLDDSVLDARQTWAAEIRRSRHIGDFRHWKSHDDYVAAFERLVKNLKK